MVYLHKIKEIVDSLAAIGDKVSDSDLLMHALNGLVREYDNFVISAHNRDTPYSFGELKARLIAHEQWISDQNRDSTVIFDAQNPVAFYGT